MTATAASPAPARAPGSRAVTVAAALVSIATAVTLLVIAVLPLLTPVFIHPALDASSSAAWLGMTPEQAHVLSDRTVHELVFGPGSFAFAGPDGAPFYQADEAAHLHDARTLLFLFLGLGVVCAAAVSARLLMVRGNARRDAWRAVARGGSGVVVGVMALGIVGFLAFEPAFELFHEIFFPGGNWAFDPSTSHMVQLYPYLFWQITAGTLGAIAAALGLLTWWLARSRMRALPTTAGVTLDSGDDARHTAALTPGTRGGR